MKSLLGFRTTALAASIAAAALLLSTTTGCGSDDNEGNGGAAGCEKCPAGGSGGSGGNSGGAPSGGQGGSPSGGAGGSFGGSGGTGGAGGSGGGAECLSQAQGIAVADVDLDGFPSYAVDGCKLLYVAATSNELRARDLTSGAEELIAPASENPRRPTLAGDVMAWEADASGKSVVRVRNAGQTETVSLAYARAGEPRATTDAVVFTVWVSADPASDSDVVLHEFVGAAAPKLVAGGAGQQRFSDVSATHIAVSDFSEDPSGIYSGDGTTQADVIIFDRAAMTPIARKLPGKQAFPMLGSSGTVSYLEWLTVHPVPKLQQYTIQAVPLATPTATSIQIAKVDSEQAVRPTARAGYVEWVVRWGGQSTLWRALADGSQAPAQVSLGTASVLHAPSASSNMTVLAVRQSASDAPALVAVPR